MSGPNYDNGGKDHHNEGDNNYFTTHAPLTADQSPLEPHYEEDARHIHDGIIRNDKLLNDGSYQECASLPHSSRMNCCAASAGPQPRTPQRNLTLNQNIHDGGSMSFGPPPPMTCMAPMAGGSTAHAKMANGYPPRAEQSYTYNIYKEDMGESLLHDSEGSVFGSSPPTSSSWLGNNVIIVIISYSRKYYVIITVLPERGHYIMFENNLQDR